MRCKGAVNQSVKTYIDNLLFVKACKLLSILSMLALGRASTHGSDRSPDQFLMLDPLSYFSYQPVILNWFNKGCGIYHPVWDGAYKRSLAANWKEYPMKWQQQVSSFIIPMVLNIFLIPANTPQLV